MKTAAFVANNTIHRGTKMTPSELLFGFTNEIPVILKRTIEPFYSHEDIVSQQRMSTNIMGIGQEYLVDAKKLSKEYLHRVLHPYQFHVGDKVMFTGPRNN